MNSGGLRTLGVALALAMAATPPPVLAGEIELGRRETEWGLEFRHHDGSSGRRYLPETMGAGVIVFDYDDDGDPDVLFVDGGALPGSPVLDYGSRLFRNDGGGRFVDVTARSGLATRGYGSGGTAGDIDGDGDLDLYLTAFGANLLFVNQGDGAFVEDGSARGVADDLWSMAAAFADVDRDGDLDLYVANYVDFEPRERTPCKQQDIEVYCHPGRYEGLPDRFFLNRGDGFFEEASGKAGLAVDEPMAGLGVAFGDLNDDGWPDLYVANDADPNFLFLNLGNGAFEETALVAGAAYGDNGRPEAGMGVAIGDSDGDGRLDLAVTNFELETNALYVNRGGGIFSDRRFAANIAESSLLMLAFGVVFADLDADADLDLVIANGHILDNAASFHQRSRYEQPNQIFENLGEGKFRELEALAVSKPRVSRGLATGDLDGDGDLDLVVSNVNDRAEVYENLTPGGHWLGIDVRSRGANGFGVGARIVVESGGRRQVREVQTGSSYLSQSSLTTHFGLGAAAGDLEATVVGPDGSRRKYVGFLADHRLRVE